MSPYNHPEHCARADFSLVDRIGLFELDCLDYQRPGDPGGEKGNLYYWIYSACRAVV